MEKFKKILEKTICILLEHLTLFATILASVYIVIDSQIRTYSVEMLLLWIISLLGLIATATASEKFFKLNKIEKEISSINQNLLSSSSSLDDIFLTRKELLPLEERLKESKSIVITGGSLTRLSDEYYALFQSKLSQQCTIEIIIVKPYSNAANMLCDNVVYETSDYDKYSSKIEESLERFIRLKNDYPNLVTIRLSNNTPPFSIIGTDLNSENASMKIELYSFACPTRERYQFFVKNSDKASLNFFKAQLDELRKTSETLEDGSEYRYHNK